MVPRLFYASESGPQLERPRASSRMLRFWRWRGRWLGITKFSVLLRALEQERLSEAALPVAWLLRHREAFRDLRDTWHDPFAAAAIRIYLQDCPDAMMPLGVWMLCQCATRFDLCNLPSFERLGDPRIARCLARTYWKHEAWPALERLGERPEATPIAQWYLQHDGPRRPFADRLAMWTAHVEPGGRSIDPTGPTALWFRDWPWTLSPPKSAEAIRRLLRRIHWLVRNVR